MVLLQACKSDEVQQPCLLQDVQSPVNFVCPFNGDLDTMRQLIQGSWSWLQEERRQRGKPIEYLNPKNQGYSKVLILDSEEAKFYKCDQLVDTYKYSVLLLGEISGTDFPEDQNPVIVYYNAITGSRINYVPLVICSDSLAFQHQFVSSVIGEEIWKKFKK